ncbi:hypothetical protein ILUMI_22673 [Ignelater luminosus]|uniref:Fibronectin type-III domain-containing protein n=1 Tax=Ignelater luminosus TaxID=2038154 RepID=A0A8K0FXB1_IGNLU|nr:hypothetical protein ILUMI_22673 [Ignelater luminosus]
MQHNTTMDPNSPNLAAVKCNCGRCDCLVCSAEIMKRREAARKHPNDCVCTPGCDCVKCVEGAKRKHKNSMECCDPTNPHPPDCDCVDCLCEPCGTYPAEGDSPRPHPPDCDCFNCLCEPCGDMEDGCDMDHQPDQPNESKTLTEVLRCSREASCRELLKDKMPEHPPGCKCIVCRCSGGKTEEKGNQEGDTKVQIPRKFPPKVCTCVECRCLIESPPILIQQIAIIQSDLESTEESGTESRIESETESGIERRFEAAQLPHCDCIDCLLFCDTACPDPTVTPGVLIPDLDSYFLAKCGESQNEEVKEEIQDNKGMEPEQANKKDAESIHTESTEVEIRSEDLDRQREISELQDVIKQIQCACYEAELQAAKTFPTPNAFVVQQGSSYEDTMSGLQLALSSLQDKCKQKDRMIAAMTKELKVRANSKVFSDMLQRINQPRFDDKEIIVDFDRKEVCDSLPRPICDPRYGKPSNQLREPVICQPCEHSDYPNCSCKIIQQIPPCSHPNYPNCPCKKADDKPPSSKPIFPKSSSVRSKKDISCQCSTTQCKPSAEKLLKPNENEKIPGESAKDEFKPDALKCSHPDYPDCSCKKETNKPSSSKKSQPKSMCEHPDFPRCPCVPGYSKSQPKESKSAEEPIATEQDKSTNIEQEEFPENILDESLEKENELAAKLTQTVEENVEIIPTRSNERRTVLPPCLRPRIPTCVCKPTTKSAASMPAQHWASPQIQETSFDRTNKKPAKSQRKCICKDKNKNLSHKHCSLPNATKKSRTRAQSPSCVCHTHSNISSPPCGMLKDEQKPSTSKQKPAEKKSSSKSNKFKEQEKILKESNLADSDSFKSTPNCGCPDGNNSRPTSAGKQSTSETPLTTTVKIEISPLASSSPELCSCNLPGLHSNSSHKLQPPPGEIISSLPMEVTDIRRISPDSLLIKWVPPKSKYVVGYEILVDGVIKSRVRSPDRTSAVLHMLNIKDAVNIMIYAITALSRCQPPAIAIYQL